jgi:hypothetical protein
MLTFRPSHGAIARLEFYATIMIPKRREYYPLLHVAGTNIFSEHDLGTSGENDQLVENCKASSSISKACSICITYV